MHTPFRLIFDRGLHQLLKFFLREHKAPQDTYLNLTPSQRLKLQYLTILTVVTTFLSSDSPTTTIPYSAFEVGTDASAPVLSTCNLEELLVDCIYSGLIFGKLNQVESCLHIRISPGGLTAHRDVQPVDLSDAIRRLESWSEEASRLSAALVGRADGVRVSSLKEDEIWSDLENEAKRVREGTETKLSFRIPPGRKVVEGKGEKVSAAKGLSGASGGDGRSRKGKRSSGYERVEGEGIQM
uniref:PCI domain-containing protein n=1 Tax=Corethron hystrix TaxID=216773 RepID=A0A7S1FYQ1_9STRA|mmetsp:Transcript_37940/g.88281  ORF Transcript_37940/g.88281 Transcript_37940/m.88281 type:complete len:240 (+) Transcript_37940:484-1203(+)